MVTWTRQDVGRRDTRPGTRVNFITRARNLIAGGLTGVVAATVRAPWGPENRVQRINSLAEYERMYTIDVDNNPDYDGHFTVREIFAGGASAVLVNRLVEGTGAASTIILQATDDNAAAITANTATFVDAITLTALREGALGNRLEISVEANPTDALRKELTLTMEDSSFNEIANITISTTHNNELDGMLEALVSQINDSAMNEFITAELHATAPATPTLEDDDYVFTGGDDGADLAGADYTAAMDALSQEKFESVYFGLDPASTLGGTTLSTIASWVTSERNRGKKITWYTGNNTGGSISDATGRAVGFGDDGIVVVSTGFRALDNRGREASYGGWQLAARIAGIVAGLRLTESATFRALGPGIIDLEVRHKDSDIKTLLLNGVMPIVYDGVRFKIERGINTYTTFTVEKGDIFSKMQPLRILDNMNDVIQTTVDEFIIGKNPNSEEGREDALAIVNSLLEAQAGDGYIEDDFILQEDPNITSEGDDAFVQVGMTPIDSIEFMWFNINLS